MTELWADLNPIRGSDQASNWPVIILSQDIFVERPGTVIAVAITSHRQGAGFLLTLELRTFRKPKKPLVRKARLGHWRLNALAR